MRWQSDRSSPEGRFSHLMPRKSRFGGASVVQMGKRKMQVFENQALAFCWVPGAGIEPARIAPLVFETSASTDSAIRACTSRREDRRIDVEGGRPSG